MGGERREGVGMVFEKARSGVTGGREEEEEGVEIVSG